MKRLFVAVVALVAMGLSSTSAWASCCRKSCNSGCNTSCASTTNCGSRVVHLDEERRRELFAELETFGVRHDDPDMRNVTYRQTDGRFCVVDFELATILPKAG